MILDPYRAQRSVRVVRGQRPAHQGQSKTLVHCALNISLDRWRGLGRNEVEWTGEGRNCNGTIPQQWDVGETCTAMYSDLAPYSWL